MDDFTMPWPSSCQVMLPSSTKWSDGFRRRVFDEGFVDEDRKHMEKDWKGTCCRHIWVSSVVFSNMLGKDCHAVEKIICPLLLLAMLAGTSGSIAQNKLISSRKIQGINGCPSHFSLANALLRGGAILHCYLQWIWALSSNKAKDSDECHWHCTFRVGVGGLVGGGYNNVLVFVFLMQCCWTFSLSEATFKTLLMLRSWLFWNCQKTMAGWLAGRLYDLPVWCRRHVKTNSLRLFNPSHLFYIPPFHIVYALGDVNGDEHEDKRSKIKWRWRW